MYICYSDTQTLRNCVKMIRNAITIYNSQMLSFITLISHGLKMYQSVITKYVILQGTGKTSSGTGCAVLVTHIQEKGLQIEQAQIKAKKIIVEMESMSYEKRLKGLGLLSLAK